MLCLLIKGSPEYVVDADDALLVGVLCVADERGAGLHPRVAALLVQEAEVVAHHLALVQYYETRNNY